MHLQVIKLICALQTLFTWSFYGIHWNDWTGENWHQRRMFQNASLYNTTQVNICICNWQLFVVCHNVWRKIHLLNILISSHLSPLTSEVVGAPQMTLQQYLSTLPCLLLPSGNLQTPFPFIPWCYLPISFSVFLSFLLLSLSPAELSSTCPILKCGHTICVVVSLPWLGDHLHSNCNSNSSFVTWSL